MLQPSRRLVGMVAVVALAVVAAGAGWWFFLKPRDSTLTKPGNPLAALPFSTSPYWNTGAAAGYVGSAACIRCHAEEHKAYLRTGMSRSTAEVNLETEPPDGAFDHALSHRRFEVQRKDGQMRHRELFLASDQADGVLNDFPLKYVIGSGRHGRTYVVEADGFLVESPLSWYASRRQWGMSPGYDQPAHSGFERAIGTQCLSCHVGRYEVLDQSMHRYRIVEAAIGCERCHGPGSLHVARRDKNDRDLKESGDPDLTIVNPRRLARDLAEAVCQQCHLSSDVMILAPGRKLTDFRPGLPLQDVQLVYGFADTGQGMAVTGHVEQLHQSKCYQRSQSLTCTTCHDPHGFPEPNRRVAYYRAACLNCHGEDACKVDPGKRQKESPENSCIKCHMPTGATDVPHLAFNHHRIGVHGGAEPFRKSLPAVAPWGGREALVPFHDQSHYSALDRKRALGLAYAKAGAHQEIAQVVAPYNQRAQRLLTEVWAAGVRDGPVSAALAHTNYWLGQKDLGPYVESALRDGDLDPQDRCDMLFLLADSEFRSRNYAQAAEILRQITRLRRNSIDWSYLSKCVRAEGRPAEALKLLETAAQIGSMLPRLHQELAEAYDMQGDRERAQRQRNLLPKK